MFVGGAEVSVRLLAQRLAASGRDVTVVGSHVHITGHEPSVAALQAYGEHLRELGATQVAVVDRHALTYRLAGMRCVSTSNAEYLRTCEAELAQGSHDVVLAMLEQGEEVLRASASRGVRTVAWIHDVSDNGLACLESDPALVLATSRFVARAVGARFAGEVRVFYPPFDFRENPNGHAQLPGDCVSMVNPIPEKGGDLAFRLAALNPGRTFLFVEGWRWSELLDRYRLPNVHYLPPQIDMSTFWRRTRVLIVPSRLPEGFGRVVVEANLRGIPVLAARRGGLSEAVGTGGILIDKRDPAHWSEKLAQLDDEARFRALAARALVSARRFERDVDAELVALGVL
ncbi:MAG: glycosyltransferase [Burkholderiales bacterium]|nr:glycosyltransferase [Burkholderiales bacterium]